MIKDMAYCEKEAALRVGEMMVAAAKTAPKGSGKDKVIGYVLEGSIYNKAYKAESEELLTDT